MHVEHSAIADLLASAQPLRAWLADKSPYTIVGVRGQPTDCPVAAYLGAKTVAGFISVGCYSVLIGDDMVSAKQLTVPYWCTLSCTPSTRLAWATW